MSAEASRIRWRPPAALRLGNAGVVYALGMIVVVLTIASQAQGRVSYLGPTNVSNILDQTTLLGIMAVTTTLVLISGNFDLSVGAVAALGAAVCLSLADEIGFWPALLTALACGALIGLFNGVVVQYVGINAFVVTLGTMTAVRGIVLLVTDGRTVTAAEGAAADGLRSLDSGSWVTPNLYLLAGIGLLALGGWRAWRARQAGGSRHLRAPRLLVPLLAGAALIAASPGLVFTIRITQRTFYMLALVAVAALVLRYTTIGRRLYASGGNADAARLSGIAVDRYKVVVFVLNGTTAAFVGVLYAARLGSINPNGLTAFELTALAAAILGGTSLFGGMGSVAKSLVGALILITLENGFNILNLGANWQGLIEGIVLIVAAGAYTISLRRRQTRKIREEEVPAAAGPAEPDGGGAPKSSAPQRETVPADERS